MSELIWLVCDDCGTEYSGEAGDECPQCEIDELERRMYWEDQSGEFEL